MNGFSKSRLSALRSVQAVPWNLIGHFLEIAAMLRARRWNFRNPRQALAWRKEIEFLNTDDECTFPCLRNALSGIQWFPEEGWPMSLAIPYGG